MLLSRTELASELQEKLYISQTKKTVKILKSKYDAYRKICLLVVRSRSYVSDELHQYVIVLHPGH